MLNKFRNLKFRTKLAIPISLIALLMVGFTLENIRLTGAMRVAIEGLGGNYLPGTRLLLDADRDLYQSKLAERTLLSAKTKKEKAGLYQEMIENAQQAKDRAIKAGAIFKTEKAEKAVAHFLKLHAVWTGHGETFRNAISKGQLAKARKLSDGPMAVSFDKMRGFLDDNVTTVNKDSKQLASDADALAAAAQVEQVIVLIIGLVMCGLIGFIFPKFIGKSVEGINLRVKDIAEGEGDLTQRVDVNSKDELGQLGSSFNLFMEKMQKIIGRLKEHITEVDTSSDSLTAASQNLSSSSEQSSQQSKGIASAATQMNQSLQMVAAAIEEVSVSIAEVSSKTVQANTIANKADELTANTTKVIADLDAKARQISSVVDTIREITEQTKLLALNASIEAASAGDAGKGFMVVASEVKELARQVHEASEGITEQIDSIQEKAKETVQANEEISSIVRQVKELSTGIASAVEEQSTATKEISLNVNHTSTASAEVAKAVQEISVFAKNVADDSKQTSSLADNLKVLSKELTGIVQLFRI